MTELIHKIIITPRYASRFADWLVHKASYDKTVRPNTTPKFKKHKK